MKSKAWRRAKAHVEALRRTQGISVEAARLLLDGEEETRDVLLIRMNEPDRFRHGTVRVGDAGRPR